MERKPVVGLDRNKDIVSSSHEEIQESRGKAKNTIQSQANATGTNHDLKQCFSNLKIDDEQGATGYSACSVSQPEEADDFQDTLTERVDTDGMYNTCAMDTILKIFTELQLHNGAVHDFFKYSDHKIYQANSILPQLHRQRKFKEMRRLFADNGKNRSKIWSPDNIDSLEKISSQKDWAADINDLIKERYVIKELFFTDCADCGLITSTEVVNCIDLRPKDEEETLNCLSDEMVKNPKDFFFKELEVYLKSFSFYNNRILGTTESHLHVDCKCKSGVINEVKDSIGCPAPVFFVMIPIKGSSKSGNLLLEEAVKDIPPLCCLNYEYVLGAIIVFMYNPGDHLGHYIAHIYRIDPGSKTKYYRYCNSKGFYKVEDFKEEGDCVTFLFFRTK